MAITDVLDGCCLELVQHAQDCYLEADKVHGKGCKNRLRGLARKFELAAALIYKRPMGKEKEGNKVVAKAVVFLALYNPNSPNVEEAMDKATEVVDGFIDKAEENEEKTLLG